MKETARRAVPAQQGTTGVPDRRSKVNADSVGAESHPPQLANHNQINTADPLDGFGLDVSLSNVNWPRSETFAFPLVAVAAGFATLLGFMLEAGSDWRRIS